MKGFLCWLVLSVAVWGQGALYDQAMEYYLKGETEPALRLFEQARQQKDLPEFSLWIGWCNLRLNRLEAAEAAFQIVLTRQPDQAEAATGLGYVRLRQKRYEESRQRFGAALSKQPDNKDALTGMALVSARQERLEEARSWAHKVLALDPKNQTALELVEQLDEQELPEAPVRPRQAYVRPPELQLGYRAGRQYFQVQQPDGGWQDVYIQGMNLGPALPGRFPSQFPQSRELYLGWLQQMAAMGCNVVRVYTVLPPGFYQAFWEYHQDPHHLPLWLIHGVWSEEPPSNNYNDPAYQQEFHQEIEDVVNLLHGQADLAARPGHAWGHYTDDCSPWVLAILLGREWEPYTVEGFNRLHPDLTYHGKYVSAAPTASPMEACMAGLCDYTVAFEMDRYHAQRPISFTNWPTLDPMEHRSEATRAEAAGILAQRGEMNPVRTREYDNDGVGISSRSLQASSAFPAGLYASYHAYPYYPDFMLHESAYAQARSSYGVSHYFGYLQELKNYYRQMPVLIAEYGLPSSRGDCHLQPEGLDHGGHDEADQARGDVRLTREIREAGCAGGCMFAWIDEWFKKNWLVIDREIPLERNRLWLNYLDAEQNYGMLAMRPGSSATKTLSGRLSEWSSAPLAASRQGNLRKLWAASDEGFFYLAVQLGQDPDWSRDVYSIAIDTIDPEAGEHRLGDARLENGAEFVLHLGGPGQSRLLVAHGYRPYIEIPGPVSMGSALIANPQMLSPSSQEGRLDPIVVESNRARLGRDGTVYPALRQDWGQLRSGSLDPAQPDYTSLADWRYSPASKLLEVRLPWGLLGVTDPSSQRLIYEPWESANIDTRRTDGFALVAIHSRAGQARENLPLGPQPLASTVRYLWSGWQKPTYHSEPKAVYAAMRRLFQEFGGRPPR